MQPGVTASTEPRPNDEVERLIGMLRMMLLIREFEHAARSFFERGLMRGGLHQSIGQEAVAVGVCANLRRDDLVQSNHRGHHHALAKGADPLAMIKELLGRVGGSSGGKGGSMHIADFSVGMMGANGILADGMTLAVGAAHAVGLKGGDQVVTVFVGDGTTNRGPYFEALNWAKVFNLPVLVVCEDNVYASSTLTESVTAGDGPAVRAAAFDIPAMSVDGNDLLAVDEASGEMVARIRRGNGPHFLHARTYRLAGHIWNDPMTYRPAGETEARRADDPIDRLEKVLLANGVRSDTTRMLRDEARDFLSRAAAEAELAPFPHPDLAFTDVLDTGGARWK